MNSGFLLGFLAPVRGVTLIWQSRRLQRLAVLPFIITVLIFAFGLAWGLPALSSVILPIIPKNSFEWLITALVWPAMLFTLLVLLWFVSRIIAGPLYALLSEAVLEQAGRLPAQPFSLRPWAQSSMRMLLVSVVRAVIMSLVSVALLLCSFIPGLGFVAPFGFMIILAFDLCDYGLEALQLPLGERLKFLRQNFLVLLGFGAVMGLVFLMPGLNFFLFPASVVGATDIVRRKRG